MGFTTDALPAVERGGACSPTVGLWQRSFASATHTVARDRLVFTLVLVLI